MSFRLMLLPRTAGFDAAAFARLFDGLPNLIVEADQAAYQNPDTGVYFLFDWVAAGGDPDHPQPHVRFAINLFRPDCFGLEAAQLLAQVAGRGAFTVADPQAGTRAEAFDMLAFVESWRSGNLAEHRRRLGASDTVRHALPAAENRAVWEWNRGAAALQATLGEPPAVPLLGFYAAEGSAPHIAFPWLAELPTVLPPAATALVLADRGEPGVLDRLRGREGERVTHGLVELALLRDLGLPVRRLPGPDGLLVLHAPADGRSERAARALALAVARARPVAARVPADQLLDLEMIAAARR